MRTLTVLALVVLLAACAHKEEAEPEVHAIVEVKVAQAELADLQLQVQAPATLYPREQAGIASKITAPIRSLAVKKGDVVAAGQLLAQLDDRDLLAQRTEVLDRARADAASAQATYSQAQKNLERRQKLFEQGALPNRELLATQTEFAQAKANHEAAQKFLALLQNTAPDGSTGEKGHTAFLNAQLQFTQIRSPFAGVITEQFQYPGDMAKPEVPIFTVMDLSVAVARAQVPESEMGGVARGQACAFAGTDSHQANVGRVSVVNQVVDPERRTVEVWCEIENSRRMLRSGAFGAITIQTSTAPKSIVVPKAAVQFEEGTSKGNVWVVAANKVRKQEVETAGIFQGRVRILSGLKAGDTVVIEGGYGLPDGTEVRLGEEKHEEKKP